MLKKRIIPCLDVKDGKVVKGVNFVNLIDAGDPIEQAIIYDSQGADEILLWIPQTGVAIGAIRFFVCIFHNFLKLFIKK